MAKQGYFKNSNTIKSATTRHDMEDVCNVRKNYDMTCKDCKYSGGLCDEYIKEYGDIPATNYRLN